MEGKEGYSICRLCLLDGGGLTDIFEANPADGWSVAHLIEDLVQLQVSRDDGYPNLICSSCMSKLRAFKAFKKQCHTSKITFDNVYTFIKERSKYKPPEKGSSNSKASNSGNNDSVREESSSRHNSTDGLDTQAVYIKTEDVSVSEEEVDFGSLNTQTVHPSTEDAHDSMEMITDKEEPPGGFAEEGEGQITSDEQQSPSSFVKDEEERHNDSNMEDSFSPFDMVQTSMEDQQQAQGDHSPAIFITTIKGNRKLIHEGYAYVVDKSRHQHTYWRCDMRKCSGRAKTVKDVVQGSPSKHNHPPDDSRIIKLRYIHRVKQLAGETDVRPAAILQTCAQDFPDMSGVASLPKRDTLAKLIRRQRVALENDTHGRDNFARLEDSCQQFDKANVDIKMA